MAEMYNYWCPVCGTPASIAEVDRVNYKCHICGGNAELAVKGMTVPKITKAQFKFRAPEFSETAVKNIETTDYEEELDGSGDVDSDESTADDGKSKSQRKVKKYSKRVPRKSKLD